MFVRILDHLIPIILTPHLIRSITAFTCLVDLIKWNVKMFGIKWSLMLSSHLPRTPCDKFAYDFPCDFLGIVGGYGLRRMCSHCLRASCDFFYGASGATRGKSIQRLCRDCTEIVQCQCSCRAVSAASARKSYGARVGIGLRTVPMRGLCNATYGMSTGYGLTIFSNL